MIFDEERLDADTLRTILSYLDYRSLSRIDATSRRLHAIASEDSFWERLCDADFSCGQPSVTSTTTASVTIGVGKDSSPSGHDPLPVVHNQRQPHVRPSCSTPLKPPTGQGKSDYRRRIQQRNHHIEVCFASKASQKRCWAMKEGRIDGVCCWWSNQPRPQRGVGIDETVVARGFRVLWW